MSEQEGDVATFFVSLDGVVEAPQNGTSRTSTTRWRPSIGAAMGSSDAMLCGRVTYQEWAGFSADADNDIGRVHEHHSQVRRLDYARRGRVEQLVICSRDVLRGRRRS